LQTNTKHKYIATTYVICILCLLCLKSNIVESFIDFMLISFITIIMECIQFYPNVKKKEWEEKSVYCFTLEMKCQIVIIRSNNKNSCESRDANMQRIYMNNNLVFLHQKIWDNHKYCNASNIWQKRSHNLPDFKS